MAGWLSGRVHPGPSGKTSKRKAAAAATRAQPSVLTGCTHRYIGLGLAIASSVAIGTSFIITKKGLQDAASRSKNSDRTGPVDSTEYLKNPIWWAGMLTSEWELATRWRKRPRDGQRRRLPKQRACRSQKYWSCDLEINASQSRSERRSNRCDRPAPGSPHSAVIALAGSRLHPLHGATRQGSHPARGARYL